MSAMFDDALVRKLDNGMTLPNACVTYGLSYDAVQTAYMRVHGTQMKLPEVRKDSGRQVFTRETVECMSELWKLGSTISEIAMMFGISWRKVDRHIRNNRKNYPYRRNMGNKKSEAS